MNVKEGIYSTLQTINNLLTLKSGTVNAKYGGMAYFYKRFGVVEMWYRMPDGVSLPRNQWVTLFTIPNDFKPMYGNIDRLVPENLATSVTKNSVAIRIDNYFNVMAYIYNDSVTSNQVYFDMLYLAGGGHHLKAFPRLSEAISAWCLNDGITPERGCAA